MNKKKPQLKKTRSKKPQLKIPAKKLFLITSLMIVCCLFILLISILFRPNSCALKNVQDGAGQTEKEQVSKPSEPAKTEPNKKPISSPEDSGAKLPKDNRGLGDRVQAEGPPAEKPPAAPPAEKPPADKPKTPGSPAEKPVSPSAKPLPSQPDKPSLPPKIIDTKPLVPKPPLSPPIKKKAKLVFVFDDGGNKLSQTLPFLNLPFPLTIAVLPGLADSAETAKRVRKAGKEVFLHQPMQAIDLKINPGPCSIQPAMSTGEAARIVRKNLAEIGPVAGMNNHEGSLITADRKLIGAVLDVCIDEGIIFLDSRTNVETAAPQAALERDMRIWERDIFLDNSSNKAEILAMLNKGLAIADKKGYAIMIGHVWSPILVEILSTLYPELKRQGYEFTTLSKMAAGGR